MLSRLVRGESAVLRDLGIMRFRKTHMIPTDSDVEGILGR